MTCEEWQLRTIKDLCTVKSSKRIFKNEYCETGIPFYRSKEIIQKALGEEVSDCYYISTERYNQIKMDSSSPQAADILLSSVGNRSGIPYRVKVDDGDFYFKDGNLIWFTDFDDSLDSQYLLYWLKSQCGQNALNSIMIGSAQKALTIVGVSNLTLLLPCIETQERIADILGSLDDKIELNRQMNATLEAIARAIFKSWFVGFDPVYAKMEGRDYPLPAEIMDLFPDELVDSELGLIPQGWEVGRLGDLVTLITDRVVADESKDNEKYIALDDMPTKSLDMSKYRSGKDVNSSITRFSKGDILFGSMRPYFHKVGLCTFEGITRTTTFVLRPKTEFFKLYALLWFFSDQVVNYATNSSIGTTIPYVKYETLSQYQIPFPSQVLLRALESLIQPFITYIGINGEESNTLSKIRDTLLPKLMSGEIEV
jgi:type I restriction enzyme, S subunit